MNICTYVYAFNKNNEKGGYEFEWEQGGVYNRALYGGTRRKKHYNQITISKLNGKVNLKIKESKLSTSMHLSWEVRYYQLSQMLATTSRKFTILTSLP